MLLHALEVEASRARVLQIDCYTTCSDRKP
jgi:hypothetical protein